MAGREFLDDFPLWFTELAPTTDLVRQGRGVLPIMQHVDGLCQRVHCGGSCLTCRQNTLLFLLRVPRTGPLPHGLPGADCVARHYR